MNPYLDYFDISILEIGNGRARMQMPVKPEYLQGAGAMQGGLIVSLADEAIAHAMMTQLLPSEGLTTIELHSSFLAGVNQGNLIAEAEIFKKGRSLMIGDCLVSDQSAKKICRVSATFLLLKNERSQSYEPEV